MKQATPWAVALVLIGLTARAEPAAPTWQDAANASYPGIYDVTVTLEGGTFEGPPFAPGAASRPRLTLMPGFIRSADVDGDGRDESLVLLVADDGGSGSFRYLALLGGGAGEAETRAVAPLGDRVQVISAEMHRGAVVLRVVQAGAGDPACCPGEVVDRSFLWRDGGLAADRDESVHRLSPADLTGRTWTLQAIDGESDSMLEPPVTLVIDGDLAGGHSGCNDYRGSVAAGESPGRLRFGVLSTTRRNCPDPQSGLELRFLAALGTAAQFRFEATRLVIAYGDELRGRLVFR